MKAKRLFIGMTVLCILFLCACSPRINQGPLEFERNESIVIVGEEESEDFGSDEKRIQDINIKVNNNQIDETNGNLGENLANVVAGYTSDKYSSFIEDKKRNNDESRIFETEILAIYDADTVLIKYKGNNTPLRILNIDSPEDTKTKEWLGDTATSFAKEHLSGKKVIVELSEKEVPRDDYGRLLGSIFIDGVLYQELILAEGLAIVRYVYEPDTKYADYLRTIENKAKEKKKNVWSVEGYVKEGNKGFDMSVIDN